MALLLAWAPLLAAAGEPPRGATQAEALPFVEDDYPRALAEARRRKVPLFVDAWAPWCHSCRFLRAHVLTDAALRPHAGRFVWLAIDTEQARNATFLGKYPVQVWPTLMVIDPAREQAALRWPGGLTVPQLVRLLEDGERAVGGPRGERTGLAALARADRLAASGKHREAARGYRELLPELPADRRARAIESLLGSFKLGQQEGECAQAALELVPTMPRGPSFANAASFGLGCAEALPAAERGRVAPPLAALVEEALGLPGLLADDRSGLFEQLVERRERAGDAAGTKALAARWLGFLEAEAARARGIEQRAAFDPHRAAAALALREPMRAVPALVATERDLPADYNAPARLALLYRAAGRLDDALAAIHRALARVYGPRTLRLLDLLADLQEEKGDRAGARRTLEQALRTARALSPEQRRDQLVAMFEQKLAASR